MNNFLNNPQVLQQMLISGLLNRLVQGQPAPKNTHENCNLSLGEHLKYADALVSLGIISKDTGKSMKEKMTATFSKKPAAPSPAQDPKMPEAKANPLFESEFLKARECLLKYLENLDTSLNEEDLREIESVVLELEKSALQKNAEKTQQEALNALNEANEISKSRLACGSLTNQGAKTAPQKTFTREEIAQMNTAEFLKNEPVINYQLQNGLL